MLPAERTCHQTGHRCPLPALAAQSPLVSPRTAAQGHRLRDYKNDEWLEQASMSIARAADLQGNMAMHEPCTRIVELEGDKQEPCHRQQGDIAPRWIVKIQSVISGVECVVARS